MLLVMCRSEKHRYAVNSRQVIEVLPRVGLQPWPQCPAWLAGMLIYRGGALPVLDLPQIADGRPCCDRLSSRIVILEAELRGIMRRLGLLAERVGLHEWTDTSATGSDDSVAATALGQVFLDDQGIFQLIDLTRLVPEERQAVLFPAARDT